MKIIKLWWHCLWNIFKGHRMTTLTWSDGSKEWCCSECDKRVRDLLRNRSVN